MCQSWKLLAAAANLLLQQQFFKSPSTTHRWHCMKWTMFSIPFLYNVITMEFYNKGMWQLVNRGAMLVWMRTFGKLITKLTEILRYEAVQALTQIKPVPNESGLQLPPQIFRWNSFFQIHNEIFLHFHISISLSLRSQAPVIIKHLLRVEPQILKGN